MSRAEPMSHARRAALYGAVRTPRQNSRYQHKLRRDLGMFLAGDGHYPGDTARPIGRPPKRYTRSGGGRPRLLPRKVRQAEAWHLHAIVAPDGVKFLQWLRNQRRTATKGRPTPRQRKPRRDG